MCATMLQVDMDSVGLNSGPQAHVASTLPRGPSLQPP